MTRSAITPADRLPAHQGFGGSAGEADTSAPAAPPAAPLVSPELVARFMQLINEVTDELMKGQAPDVDRRACRADAIRLLIATSTHPDVRAETAESPLMYLLREEQQKCAARFGTPSAGAPALTFLRV